MTKSDRNDINEILVNNYFLTYPDILFH